VTGHVSHQLSRPDSTGVISAFTRRQKHLNEKRDRRKRGDIGQYVAHLIVTTTSEELVQFLLVFGARHVVNNGSHRCYWNYEDMLGILESVKPYIKVRNQEVSLMIEFLKHTGIPGYQSQRLHELNKGISREREIS
jgi:hypothetical protein